MNASRVKTSELQEIHKIVQSTLEFYNTTLRSAKFEFGEKFDVNNHSIELKKYSAAPYCIQMAGFHRQARHAVLPEPHYQVVDQVEQVRN